MNARTLHFCMILSLALAAPIARAQVLSQQSPALPAPAAATTPMAQTPPQPAEPQSPPPSTVPSRPSKPVAVRCADAGVSALLAAPADVIEVGQELPFTLTVTLDKGVAFTPLDIGKSMGAFDVRELDRSSVREGEKRISTVRFAATTYLSGQLELPAIALAFTSADGAQHTLELGAISIEVVSLVGAEFDPSVYRDIKGAVQIGGRGFFWWVVATLALIAIAILVVLAIRRRKAASARVLTADEWATRELELLERDGLIERGEVHDFWVRLSGTLREYLERQFAIAAPDQTTKEFLVHAASHHAIDGAHRQLLARFLRAADMVKFAAHEPPLEECRKGLASAHEFVRETTPAQSTASAPQGAST